MPPHDSTARVLFLPEFIHLIFSFCLDTGDCWRLSGKSLYMLAGAAQVNRLWFECATEKIWSHLEAPYHLLLVPHHRRHMYASKIVTLHLDSTNVAKFYREFRSLEFSRLRKLEVATDGGKLGLTKPFCVPSVQKFMFSGTAIRPWMIHYLQNCLQLTTIHIDLIRVDWDHQPPFTSGVLLDIVKNLRFLQKLRFKSNSRGFISGDLLVHLAGRFTPFPRLTTLGLVAPSASIGRLVPWLRNLTSLDLKLEDSDPDVLLRIAHLTTLTKLSLIYYNRTHISAESIMALRHLSQLQKLIIRPHSTFIAPVTITSDLSDDDCERVTSHWPNLNFISLVVDWANLSTKGLISLARSCRCLTTCHTSQKFNFDELFADGSDGEVLFPQVKDMRLAFLVPGRTEVHYLTPTSGIDDLYYYLTKTSHYQLAPLVISYGGDLLHYLLHVQLGGV
ncbi:uncharacterized protein TRIVIDRAFT_63466 [Trichoderma virens Gv29-8]|uniref:F-box domain-containing protein n=1 Tax=Hypocrea virens (strain Gv29-8 / FGSC 10586) TaxID=413071 RepID=G9MHE7_HYPVG|nr:uncharacterized protein TRIVIDRAFT_63466 [Trichoderma virens Gv29-8]EHK26135.1 hypothetical protein TRIVIDRAFT_63466 [Trichoderma virens Gv29-8]